MAKKDDRPIDVGLVALAGKDEVDAVEWWKQRFGLIAAIPQETARVGALTPQLRELSRLDPAERKRLTKARMIAFVQLPADQQAPIMAARTAAFAIDRTLMDGDEAIVNELKPSVPGADAVYNPPR
ncbi:MAG TPA: hypothetical protein VIN34_10410 [Candidatus Limnocylindria bacterium]